MTSPPGSGRLAAARSARVWPVLLAAAAAGGVSQAFGRFTFSLLFTDVRDEFALSNTVAGSLGSANLVAYLLGTMVVSLMIGRVGLTRTTRVGVLGVSIGLLGLAWSPNPATIAASLLLTGFFAAGVWITVPAIAAARVAPHRRGAAIGIVGAGIGAGIVVASVLNGTLADGNWRIVYRVEALVAAVVCVAAFSLFRGTAGGGGAVSGLDAMRSVPGWRGLLVSYGLYGFGMALIVTFLVAVLEEDAGYSTTAASLAFSLFGVGTMLGGPVFGPLADRIGPTSAMSAAYAVMCLTALVIATGARPWATLAALLFGTAFTGVPTTVASRMADAVEAESFGAAYGVATLAFGVGLMAGPQLGGLLGDAVGSFRPVLVSASAVAVVAAWFGWHRDLTNASTLPPP